MTARLLDLFAPNHCDCCKREISYDRLLCADCEAALAGLHATYGDWLAQHAHMEIPWKDGAAVWRYHAEARSGILAIKSGKRGFLQYTVDRLIPAVTALPDFGSITCVTWVPVSRFRRFAQGYAHAENIGTFMAAKLAIPARAGLLRERPHALRQHQLTAEERLLYTGKFRAGGADLHGETILLCDDILTTGQTLKQCTELLLEQGAAQVFIAVAGVRILDRTVHPAP